MWLSSNESACQFRRPRLDPWVEKIPWRRKWQPTPVCLSGESHGQRSLAGYSPWGRKEMDTIERLTLSLQVFPGGSDGKDSARNLGDPRLISGSGSSPGVGNGNPLQYPCLENSVDRGAWWTTVHGVAKNQT